MSRSLGDLLAPLGDVLVVLAPHVDLDRASAWLPSGDVARHVDLTGDPTDDRVDHRAPDAVVLVVEDRLGLRAAVGACRGLPATTRVGCVLLAGGTPPLTTGRPLWPGLVALTAAADPVCFVMVELAAPMAAGEVLADLARNATPHRWMSQGWPVLGVGLHEPHLWPAGDATSVVAGAPTLLDVTGDYPPEVLVTGEGETLGRAPQHPVVGALTTVAVPAGDDGAGLALGGLDGRLLNPVGFVRVPKQPVRPLAPVPGTDLCEVTTEAGPVLVDVRRGLGETQVAALRPLQGVRLDWNGAGGPRAYCRVVVGLAMAGVPLLSGPVPAWARELVHADLLDLLPEEVDPDDPLAREVLSIRLRRAAHARHEGATWRRLVRGTGSEPARPRVTVLLPTRRPEQARFAVRQVARQRGVDLQLVVATHGHDLDAAVLDELAGHPHLDVVPLTVPDDVPFGQLLNVAARHADGDLLLKMDDDDWYGRDFVTDLLLARAYSGADVVGTPPEFLYVDPLGITVRRRDATERYRSVVAGGTMLLSRDVLAGVGGFRPLRRYVDAGVLQAVTAAGGSIYRTHGHGYLLRRGGAGHTWDPGLGYFVSRSRTLGQWRGFHPSPLLDADPADRPAPSPTKEAR